MEIFKKKARRYFIAGLIAEKGEDFDVASTNYFKSLSAINDYALSLKNLFAKNHEDRFNLLKTNMYDLYKITSSLFLTYRRTYTSEISSKELGSLKTKLKEAFENAGIDIPTEKEVEDYVKEIYKE